MLRSLGAAPLALVLACRPESTATSPAITAVAPETSAPAPRGRATLPADVAAMIDGVAIPESEVAREYRERAELRSSGEPRPEERARDERKIVDELVHARLLALELERLGLPTTPDERDAAFAASWGRTPPPEWQTLQEGAFEVTLVRALGLFEIDDDAIADAYARDKARWTSARPWVRVQQFAMRWHEPVGVARCDEWIALVRECTETKVPDGARGPMVAAIEARASMWRLAQGSERAALAAECERAFTGPLPQSAELECDLDTRLPAGKWQRKGVLRQATSLRKALAAPGVDVLATAKARRFVAYETEHSIVALDDLPEPIASAIERIEVGTVSAPVDHAHAWWLVHLVERWPAGTLPLAARRADIVAGLEREQFARARAELRKRLHEGHRVVIRPRHHAGVTP